MIRARDLRLLAVAAATWAAAFASVWWPGSATGIAVGLWSTAATGAGWLWLRPQGGRFTSARVLAALPVVVVALAVGAAVSTHVAFAATARDEVRALAAQSGRVVEMTAVVSSKVRPLRDRLWFDVETTDIRVGRDERDLAVAVTVSIERGALAGDAPLDLGSTVTLRGAGRPADEGDRAVLVLFAERGSVVRGPPHVLGLMSDLRDGFVHDVAEGLPEPGAGLLPGLAVGDTRAIPAELDAAMKAASLTHLTAVSGESRLTPILIP